MRGSALARGKLGVLILRKRLKKKNKDLEENNEELREKYSGIESELEDLNNHVIQEHINGFNKGLRQATFFCKEVDVADLKYDVNKDVVDGRLVDEDDLSVEQVEEMLTIGGGDLVVEEEVTMLVKIDPTTN